MESESAPFAALDAAGRVALVHDWLTGMRGGEKCLEVLCELFPHADLYTLLHVPGTVSPLIESRAIHTSFVQRLPGAARAYRRYLPLFPRAIESLTLGDRDLVLSTSHCVAKGVRVPLGALHVCYCHTPMRYVWDQFDAYFGPGRADPATRLAAQLLRRPLQRWDAGTAGRVDVFVANSEHVRDRIRRYYRRDAVVVYPPVDVTRFAPDPRGPEDYFLALGAVAPYKRLDVAIEACRLAGARLLVVGSGPGAARLERAARESRCTFLPWQSNEALAGLYGRCRALLFPGQEDFGIAPVECMAAGRPVIALAAGGARETVVEGLTGTLVDGDDPRAWATVLQRFEDRAFDPQRLHAHALQFDRTVYRARMLQVLHRAWDERSR